MRPSSGNRQTCECCKDASINQEFGKILDMKDVGVAIYRYLPQAQTENQKGTENGEVFIVQNIGADDVTLEKLIIESEKKNISCPRCMKNIQRVKTLLKDLPPAYIREVTSICDHCYQKEFFNCPCCENIVDKFMRFRMKETMQTEEERDRNKLWLIKTQLSLKKSFSNVKDGKESVRKPAIDSEINKKQRVKIKSELLQDQRKYRLAEEHKERDLRVHRPLKESISETKLEPRTIFEGRDREHETPASRIIPTTKPLQEHVLIPDIYEKQRARGESEPLQDQKKYRQAEEDIQKPFRDQMTFQKYLSHMTDTRLEPRTKSDSWIGESQPRYIPTKKPDEEPAPFHEKYEKQRPKGESEFIHDQRKDQLTEDILEKPLRVLSFLDFPEEDKPKPKKEKMGILKSREDGAPGDVSKPYQKPKPTKQHSFETVMKSLSEPNVSDFSYSFPHEKIVIKKQMKRQVSSSELIKNTQDMLQEREKEEKKKKAELTRLKEEKKRLADEKKRRKQEEEKAIKDKEAELEEEGEERDKTTKRKKRDDVAATTALKEQLDKQAKELSKEEKMKKQNEKDLALSEKKAREAEKSIEDNEKRQTTEKKIKPVIPVSEDRQKEAAKDQDEKSEKFDKKDKSREEKQHDLEAKSALKDQVAKQAKEKSEEEKKRKQQEQATALGEKKAKDAEKAIEDQQKQLTTDKKIKPPEVKPNGKGEGKPDGNGDKGKGEKLEKPAKEPKTKDSTLGEMAMLKEQMAKQKQQELEKEKLRKEQQKEKELAEKRLKELQTKKEEKAPVIKPILLIPEVVSDGEDVSVVILKQEEVTDIIKGQKIYKVTNIKRDEEKQPIIESKHAEAPNQYTELPKHLSELERAAQDARPKPATTSAKKSKAPDPEAAKGVIRYTLSDRTFIDKGWTMLPTEKVVRKMNVYRMRPAKPEFDWFEHNKYKREMAYDSGEKLAEFDDNGRGRWYYRSGELALDYYDAEETNAGQRFVVYSTRQPDERGRSRPRTVLATFDYSGNGIVFDHTGKIRLKFNQTEGVVLDRTIGPVSHWKWHTLNDPPVLQQVMIDTQMPYKDPTILKMGDKNADQKRPDNEEMIAIEFENFLKEKRQKLTQSFKPFQIKMKAMKINENFSLRVLDQASVYLLFRDGTTNLKINIGMVLDHKEIVDTDTAEIGEVSNTLDKLPACTDSIAGLQKAVAQAQAAERTRVRHERRLKRPEQTASADALRAGCSRPLRTPIVAASLTSCDKMTPKRFKPSCCDLYYSTQLC